MVSPRGRGIHVTRPDPQRLPLAGLRSSDIPYELRHSIGISRCQGAVVCIESTMLKRLRPVAVRNPLPQPWSFLAKTKGANGINDATNPSPVFAHDHL